MRTKLLFSLITVAFSVFSNAQPVEDIIAKAKANMQEEILVHADKHRYYTGETVWLKLYFYHPSSPYIKGTAVKTDLVNAKGEIVASRITSVSESYSTASFPLDKNFPAGRYFLRSYTRLMQASVPQAISYKVIEVVQPGMDIGRNGTVKLNIGIEGNSLVHGSVTSIAIASKNADNIPVPVSGFLLNSRNDTIAEFKTSENGLGKLSLFPEYGQQYFLVATAPAGGTVRLALPEVTRYGANLRVMDHEKGKQFFLKVADDPAHPVSPARIIGILNHSLAFDIPVPANAKEMQKIIPTKVFPASGILNIIVLDEMQNELASRTTFVNNGEYKAAARLEPVTTTLNTRGKNEFIITPTDSAFLNVSVSVVADAGDAWTNEDLASQLLLSNQLELPVYNGAAFLSNSGPIGKELDLLVLSHGYKWQWNVVKQLSRMTLPAVDEVFFTVAGTMMKKDKPLAETDINFVARQKDSIVSIFTLTTDKEGKVAIPGLVFQDSLSFYFQPNKARGTQLKWDISTQPLEKQFHLPVDMAALQKIGTIGSTPATIKKTEISYTEIEQVDTSGTLPGVVIKSYRDKTKEVEDRYVRSTLGSARATIDFINDPPPFSLNIFEYLKGRYSYLAVYGSGVDYVVVFRNTMSLSGGMIGMALFLDDFPVQSTQIATIPINQIAMVKIYATSPLTGVGGALAVYTKKGDDLASVANLSNLQKVTLKGFSATKNFLSPDYGTTNASHLVRKDNRLTLYWNPDLLIDAPYRLRFYNSDIGKKYKIVVQGITSDGRFIYEEKAVE